MSNVQSQDINVSPNQSRSPLQKIIFNSESRSNQESSFFIANGPDIVILNNIFGRD